MNCTDRSFSPRCATGVRWLLAVSLLCLIGPATLARAQTKPAAPTPVIEKKTPDAPAKPVAPDTKPVTPDTKPVTPATKPDTKPNTKPVTPDTKPDTKPAMPADLDRLEEQAIQAAVARVAPSVVRIETLGGLEKVGGKVVTSGPTTGLVVSADGYILASAFPFVQQPTSILVTLAEGRRVAARIVARDHSRMLVLLKVKPPTPLQVPESVPRKTLRVGQWTIAVGRTYKGTFPNISVGVLSAVNRIWGKAVQTDAKISANNYGGPLIDIRGRVIGILVPLSPQQQGELAGSEWYDSGIGFAVPLTEVLPRLETLKKGTDLYPGLVGISMKGTDIYSLPATIAACPAKSPARESGLAVGDTIVELDGHKIERQAQLKHALGPHYAGDRVTLTVVRGKEKKRITVTLTLAKKIDPYYRPFLGILPLRDPSDSSEGVAVRFVFPDSPAAAAAIKPGDRILAVDGTQLASDTTLSDLIAAKGPNDSVAIRLIQGGQNKTVQVKLAKVPTSVPADLPSAHGVLEGKPEQTPDTGVVDIKIPEEANKCIAYIPDTYDARLGYGLLVVLPAPGQLDQDAILERWKATCDQRDLILLVPQARDAKRWAVTEVDFVRKTIDDVISHYSIDSTRVVIFGVGASGAMAQLAAFGNRDVVRGVVPVNAPLPRRVASATTDPIQPLAIFSVLSKESPIAKTIKAGNQRLTKLAFPVTVHVQAGKAKEPDADTLDELIRWIDSLDRI